MKYFNIDEIKYNNNFGIISSEAIIYRYGDNLFKKFLNMTPHSILKNKEKKLLLLEKYEDIKKYYNEIIGIVKNEDSDFITGYIVKRLFGLQLSKLKISTDKKVKILNEIKMILEEFSKYNIYYDDLNLNNIYYTNNSVKFIDMDNISIDDLKEDINSNLNQKYYNAGGYDINKARIFFFNGLTLEFLTGKNLTKMIYQKDFDFLNDAAKKICNDLINYKIGSSADNEYIIDKILVK